MVLLLSKYRLMVENAIEESEHEDHHDGGVGHDSFIPRVEWIPESQVEVHDDHTVEHDAHVEGAESQHHKDGDQLVLPVQLRLIVSHSISQTPLVNYFIHRQVH